MDDNRVIISGAGPVGLLLALLLARKGISVLAFEKRLDSRETSNAIGITAPSLRAFGRAGVLKRALEQGLQIDWVHVHGSRRKLGSMRFSSSPGKVPSVMVLPQSRTEAILLAAVQGLAEVELSMGQEVVAANQEGSRISVRVRDVQTGEEAEHRGSYLCVCEGPHSATVEHGGPRRTGRKRYEQTFLMGEYEDESGLGAEVHLFFTRLGPVESFPLPGNRRRWIAATDRFITEPREGTLEDLVAERTGHRLLASDRYWLTPFGTGSSLLESYHRGRIFFAGDAAHTMSPIGGQGLNIGIGDADLLAHILHAVMVEKMPDPESLFRVFDEHRKIAASVAITRARYSMGIGTLDGAGPSSLRNAAVFALLHLPLKYRLIPLFSMESIPSVDLEATLKQEPLLFGFPDSFRKTWGCHR